MADFTRQHRTAESLSKEYATLVNRRTPTRDHLIPDYVKKTKKVREIINERAEMDDVNAVLEIVDSRFILNDVTSIEKKGGAQATEDAEDA